MLDTPNTAPNLDDVVAPAQNEIMKESARLGKRTKRAKLSLKRPEPRTISSIAFPYMDMDIAISVAQAILSAGGIPLTREQLAGVMKLQVNSGNFLSKVATGRTFGLVAYSQSKFELTNVGFAILDSDERRQRAARAEAFLNVPLYKKVYEDFRGKQLPPRPHGLEQAFARYGVSPKQVMNARLAFDRSAKQAGFFGSGPDRLIEPIIGAAAPFPERGKVVSDEDEQPMEKRRASAKGEPDGLNLHPFIEGLLGSLPEPETNWTIEGRAKWLQAAANIFDLMYKGDGQIQILAKGGEQ